ncbi:Rid family hydrolase [Actinomadura sp. CNU-125]|uniref:Rid family hydrolase n=1 Tax=Actinomadura sp. CNU-125 TaxID=1904961 RepID=UPI00130137CF|nr:Rid family hydrolase [Actinomadura sp. CNU-125]
MSHTPIVPDGMREMYDGWHIAPAVRAGDFVLCSGVLGVDAHGAIPADPAEQFEAVFRNLRRVLAAAGADMPHVVDMVTFHRDLDADIAAFTAVKERHVVAPYPAWTAVGAARLGAGACREPASNSRRPRTWAPRWTPGVEPAPTGSTSVRSAAGAPRRPDMAGRPHPGARRRPARRDRFVRQALAKGPVP